MKASRIILLLLLLPLFSMSQKHVIKGKVTDISEQMSIPRVNIQVKGSLNGTSSDAIGEFEIYVAQFPVTLYFSHIGYHEKEVKIYTPNKQFLVIRLEEKVNDLDEFVVTPNPVINLVKDKKIYVWDYEFADEGIVLLGSMNMNGWDKRVFMLREAGDTLISSQVKRPEGLYRDCIGYHHLLRTNDVFQLNFEGSEISLHYPMELEEFNKSMLPMVGKIGRKWFVKQYYLSNQVLVYWTVDDLSKEVQEFCRVEDGLGLNILADRARLESSQGYTEADRRFEDMCFYDEIYAPLVILGDSLLLFNFVDSEISTYSSKGELVRSTPLNFERDKHWEEELLVDQASGRIFTLWRKHGMTELWEIDVADASIVARIPIPDLPFTEKIKVNQDHVYFLYKSGTSPYKQLYTMKI